MDSPKGLYGTCKGGGPETQTVKGTVRPGEKEEKDHSRKDGQEGPSRLYRGKNSSKWAGPTPVATEDPLSTLSRELYDTTPLDR